MSLRKTKSIDALYAAVADSDIVLTNEAPLALALDNRVTTPRIGRLAATPRSYAANEMFPNDLRPLFFDVIEQTALSWKQANRALGAVIDCWTTTGDRKAICEYEEFDTESIRTVVDLLGDLDSSYRDTAELKLSPEDDIAVIDGHQLSTLDQTILPPEHEYKTVDGFASEQISLPEINIFPSATAIVSTIADQITPETADQFGIVLVEDSHYSTLIESTLTAREIPFSGGPGFEDDPDIRAFLRLLEVTFAGSNQRLGDIEGILAAAGITVPSNCVEHRVESLSASQLGWYTEFKTTAASGTFSELIDIYEEHTDADLTALRDEFEQLSLLDQSVTDDRLTQFQYYLGAIGAPTDTDGNEGVLLAGASSTAYVDRPVVFYVGLGPEWAKTPPDYPWIDKAAFRANDLARFERLLQNGEQQHYFVQETHAGSEVTPCVYLRRLIDESFESFGDLSHSKYRVSTDPTGDSPFSPPSAPASTPSSSPKPTLSQSSLKRLANCPRDEYFNTLVETPSNLPMARGNLLHEAAEIYVADPSVIDDDRETVLDAMCALLDPYLDTAKRDVERTKLEVGLTAISRYLTAHPPTQATYETYSTRDRDNELAERLDVPYDSPLTERWFASESVGLDGFVDLLHSPTTVIDYKTGTTSKDSPSDLLDAAAIDPVAEQPNFQALAYLANHREEHPDSRLEIHFVHLMHELAAAIAGNLPSPQDLVSTITYVPLTFSEFVASKDTFEQLTDYADSNARCKVLDSLGYERYREFFETHDLPPIDTDPPQRAATIETFTNLAKSAVGDYKYVSNGCEKIFGDLKTTPTGYVLQSDLDAFEVFVDEQLDNLTEYHTDRFPVAYRADGPTWDRVDHRDLILTDR